MATESRFARWWKSLHTRSTLAIIITAAVLVEATVAIQYWYAREGIRHEVRHRAEGELRVKTLEIEKVMAAVEAASNSTVWMLEERLANGDSIDNVLCRMLERNPNIVGCGIGFTPNFYARHGRWHEPYAERRKDGRLAVRLIGGEHHDYLNADWYTKVMDSGKEYWTEPYFDDAGGKTLMVTYALPLRNSRGDIIAVFGADLSLEWLSSVINAHHMYPSSYNVLISRTGQLMACPVESLVMQKSLQEVTSRFDDTMATHVNKQMLAGNTGQASVTNEHGKKSYVFYAPIFEDSLNKEDNYRLGWSMAVVCSDNEIYSSLHHLTFRLILLMLGGLALLTFIMFRTVHSMKRLQSVNAEKDRIESELNIARKIQLAMLPKIFPPYPDRTDIDIYASLKPAREVGGDFYDFLIRDEKLFFCIGDVSGKGVPAALVMAVLRTLFRNVTAHEAQPNRILMTINDTVATNNESNMFVTLFVGVLDLPTGRLRYSNAGHNAPLLIAEQADFMNCEANLPVGIMEHFQYVQQECVIGPDTTLFLYTDGLTEAEDSAHTLFGTERMMKAIEKPGTPKEYIDRMTEAVHGFVGNGEQSDDLTLLAIRYSRQQKEVRLQRSITLPNDVSQLHQLATFVNDVCNALGCDETVTMQLNLAIEEAVVNVMNYAYQDGTKGCVDILAQADEERIKFTITDSGAPFDPTEKMNVDTTLSAEERPIGGLGIHLIRQIMDSINYNRIDGKNILTLRKKLK